jgi:hypothetical protein
MMGRSYSLVSILVVAALPVACNFSKASDSEKFRDGSVAPVDVNVPNGDTGGGLLSDATVTCVEANPKTMNLPPDILIVLDRSGSMNDQVDGTTCMGGCGANSKWSVMTAALDAFLPMVTTVNWGLKYFATKGGNGGNSSCTVNTTADVAPSATAGAANGPITMSIAGTTAGSSTPTTAAVTNAAKYLMTVNDGNPKFILLATDGIPTCGTAACAAGSGAMGNMCDDANAIAAVKTVHDMGIPTFVLGIGTAAGGGGDTLTAMANAGGFPRANATPAYYPVESASDLTAAFATITQMVGQCFFGVSPALTSTEKIGGVSYSGGTIMQDATNGYTVVGTTGIQLNGQSCADFMSGKITDVKVQVDCNG